MTRPVAHQEEDKLGAPTATISVPLESNYNGSLVMRTINLTRNLTYIAKVQFCSNGGCGPEVRMTMSCDVCESLETPGSRFYFYWTGFLEFCYVNYAFLLFSYIKLFIPPPNRFLL